HPAITVAGPVLGRARSCLLHPAATGLGPAFAALVTFVGHELQVATVRHRVAVDEKRTQLGLVTRTLVVVRRASVVGADRDSSTRELQHLAPPRAPLCKLARTGSTIGIAFLQLQCLEDRFVVLV